MFHCGVEFMLMTRLLLLLHVCRCRQQIDSYSSIHNHISGSSRWWWIVPIGRCMIHFVIQYRSRLVCVRRVG